MNAGDVTRFALIDTNVIVAGLVATHEHHEPSARVIESFEGRSVISAHSYAEVYSRLTRRGAVGFGWPPAAARAALDAASSLARVLALSAPETLDAVRLYAEAEGIGPRLYDHLIGRVAVIYRVSTIITWDVGHVRALFPALDVVAPDEVLG